MAERTFTAADGTRWQAWDVVPSQHTDWSGRALRHLPEALAQGWLCFESGAEKRRMYPIPAGWDTECEPRLREYCQRAHPVTRGTASR